MERNGKERNNHTLHWNLFSGIRIHLFLHGTVDFFSYSRIVGPICVVLMCSPRLMYPKKKWSSVLLMISAILTTLALLFFDGLLIMLSGAMLSGAFGPMDVSGAIILGVITVIGLLSCYLCYRLFKLLFKTKPSV